ncbi:hypothetical protein Bca52824_046233 [Brassica carinata]|uniref:Uncharacterized protein n=1 Tax=Brassica carinata TaxID=52824 RepID=A0A8X7RJL0_BRACI|nr:hypothetical protein Bca52824_046233 [Brassica carinata]
MRHDVSRVLGILKVSIAIGFDAGVLSCLEYMKAESWSEDEEYRTASCCPRNKMMRHDVSRVLGILKVSIAIGFDAGVLSVSRVHESRIVVEDEEYRTASCCPRYNLEK